MATLNSNQYKSNHKLYVMLFNTNQNVATRYFLCFQLTYPKWVLLNCNAFGNIFNNNYSHTPNAMCHTPINCVAKVCVNAMRPNTTTFIS